MDNAKKLHLPGKLGEFGQQNRRLCSVNSATLLGKLGDFGQQIH